MKNILSIVVFSCCAITLAMAQPVLTASNYTPVIGDTFHLSFGGYYAPGPAGANQTWDFSTITEIQPYTVQYMNKTTTGYGANFPAATVASQQPGSFGFFQSSGNAYYALGNVTFGYVTTVMTYSNPEKWMEFPFAFGDSLTDNFAGSFTSTASFNRAGSIKVKADGYGTLALPDTTISGVLRVKMEEDYDDDIVYGGSTYPYQGYTTEVYMWLRPGTHYPLLTVGKLWVDGNLNSQYSQWLNKDDIASGVQERMLAAEVALFPNPTNDIFYLTVDRSLTNAQVAVYSADGRLVLEQPMEDGRNTLSLAGSPAGLYHVKVISEEGVSTQRIIKE